jgi:hypothetical protein
MFLSPMCKVRARMNSQVCASCMYVGCHELSSVCVVHVGGMCIHVDTPMLDTHAPGRTMLRLRSSLNMSENWREIGNIKVTPGYSRDLHTHTHTHTPKDARGHHACVGHMYLIHVRYNSARKREREREREERGGEGGVGGGETAYQGT